MIQRNKIFFSLSVLILSLPSFAQSYPMPQPLLASEEVRGCGTYFSLQDSEHPQIFALASGAEYGLMRFNGHLCKLKKYNGSHTKSDKSQLSIGHRVQEIWSSGELKVTLTYKVLSSNEGAHQLKGRMLIMLGGKKHALNIWGATGCELNPA